MLLSVEQACASLGWRVRAHVYTFTECPICGVYCKSVREIFSEETPEVAEAHIKLSSAINEDGVLDEKTRSLNLVGIHSTTRDTIALRHFTRMSSIAGASKEEI